MLIWANKKEIDLEIIEPIAKMYREKLNIENLRSALKAWELSIIFRQIKRHFGDRKDISILDFGAGVSPFGAYLNHLGYQDVTCLDIKRGWHREINQKTYNEKYNASVKYVKIDISSNYDAEHDVIFSASVLEHIEAKKRIDIICALARYLSPGGLFIHVVDYNRGVNFKKLIDNCGLPISYKSEETPGCREFKNPPEYAWWIPSKKKILLSSVAFWNEK